MFTHVVAAPVGGNVGAVGAAGDSLTGTSTGGPGVATTAVGVGDGELGEPLHHADATAHPRSSTDPSVRGERGRMVLWGAGGAVERVAGNLVYIVYCG